MSKCLGRIFVGGIDEKTRLRRKLQQSIVLTAALVVLGLSCFLVSSLLLQLWGWGFWTSAVRISIQFSISPSHQCLFPLLVLGYYGAAKTNRLCLLVYWGCGVSFLWVRVGAIVWLIWFRMGRSYSYYDAYGITFTSQEITVALVFWVCSCGAIVAEVGTFSFSLLIAYKIFHLLPPKTFEYMRAKNFPSQTGAPSGNVRQIPVLQLPSSQKEHPQMLFQKSPRMKKLEKDTTHHEDNSGKVKDVDWEFKRAQKPTVQQVDESKELAGRDINDWQFARRKRPGALPPLKGRHGLTTNDSLTDLLDPNVVHRIEELTKENVVFSREFGSCTALQSELKMELMTCWNTFKEMQARIDHSHPPQLIQMMQEVRSAHIDPQIQFPSITITALHSFDSGKPALPRLDKQKGIAPEQLMAEQEEYEREMKAHSPRLDSQQLNIPLSPTPQSLSHPNLLPSSSHQEVRALNIQNREIEERIVTAKKLIEIMKTEVSTWERDLDSFSGLLNELGLG